MTIRIPVVSTPFTPPSKDPTITQLQTTNLSDAIQVSTISFDKVYVKDSMSTVPSDLIAIKNISSNTIINVKLTGTTAIQFSPVSFTLQPQESKNVQITYVTVEINKLSAGNTTVKTLVSLTSGGSTDTGTVIPPSQIDPRGIGLGNGTGNGGNSGTGTGVGVVDDGNINNGAGNGNGFFAT